MYLFFQLEEFMKNFQITQWSAHFIEEQVKPGDFCIDATMGNGNDTLLLSRHLTIPENVCKKPLHLRIILYFWSLTHI